MGLDILMKMGSGLDIRHLNICIQSLGEVNKDLILSCNQDQAFL